MDAADQVKAADAAHRKPQEQPLKRRHLPSSRHAEAAKAAEEKKKAEEAAKYDLTADPGYVDFGDAPVGIQRDYIPLTIINVGNNAVDLIYTKSHDADGAFSLSLHGDKTHLEPGESTRFNVSMSANLDPGNYGAVVDFADATRDPSFLSGLTVPLRGIVTDPGPVIRMWW